MNLLEKLKGEVSSLGLLDEESIARYLYIRTGELFIYDPTYQYASDYDKKTILHKRINIRNVNDFKMVCYSWSYMYVGLLYHFGIQAKTVNSFCHKYVRISLKDGRTIDADLTDNYEDIMAIKFGMKTRNFIIRKDYKIVECSEEIDKKIGYKKGIYMEEVLVMLKEELKSTCLNKDDYIKNVMQCIQYLINIRRNTSGFISGTKFIRYLLRYFLESEYYSCNTKIFNQQTQDYDEIYTIIYNGIPHYYIYQVMNNGHYELNEISGNLVERFTKVKSYCMRNEKNLKLG